MQCGGQSFTALCVFHCIQIFLEVPTAERSISFLKIKSIIMIFLLLFFMLPMTQKKRTVAFYCRHMNSLTTGASWNSECLFLLIYFFSFCQLGKMNSCLLHSAVSESLKEGKWKDWHIENKEASYIKTTQHIKAKWIFSSFCLQILFNIYLGRTPIDFPRSFCWIWDEILVFIDFFFFILLGKRI